MCLKAFPYITWGAQGGVGLVTRERLNGWGIESERLHGPNVVSCKKVTEPTRTQLVSGYLSPLTLEHLTHFEEVLQWFKCPDPIFLGGLNVDLDDA